MERHGKRNWTIKIHWTRQWDGASMNSDFDLHKLIEQFTLDLPVNKPFRWLVTGLRFLVSSKNYESSPLKPILELIDVYYRSAEPSRYEFVHLEYVATLNERTELISLFSTTRSISKRRPESDDNRNDLKKPSFNFLLKFILLFSKIKTLEMWKLSATLMTLLRVLCLS